MDRADVTAGYLDALGMARGAPELPLLQELVRRHVARFAFSSVGPRLGDALPLDLASLYDRIVVRARGGYCFEQNALLHAVLEELGFEVRLCLARVIYNQDIHPPLTHRIALVNLGGHEYVGDVGFGPLGPPMPVSTAAHPPLRDAGTYRVHEPRPGEFHLQTYKDGGDYSLYRFAAGDYGPADCELGHFYSHRHPQAAFVNNLVASRILSDEVRSLRNRDYCVITPQGTSQSTLTSAAQLHRLLELELGLRVTDAESRRLFDATA
jgi:N-hydroxyarylamine O-acetyltransferase